MDFQIKVPDMAAIAAGIESDVATAITGAMTEATNGLKLDLRDQVVKAGLGARLANTWRGQTYPLSRRALNPAGYVWSAAPDIITAFVLGATIAPLGGKKFLWIPTENVPRQAGRGGRKAMTPFEVEVAFDQDLIIKRGRNGRYQAFVQAVVARNQKGFRRATAGRLAPARNVKLVLMFNLVPTVRMPRLLDMQGAADRWAAAVPDLFADRMR